MRPVPSRPLAVTASILTAAAIVLVGVIVVSLWASPVPARDMPDVRTGAIMAALGALICWVNLGNREHGRHEGLLIRVIADLTRPPVQPRHARRPTGPLRRVR